MTSDKYTIRQLQYDDFEGVSVVIDEWWGGRPVLHLAQRLFFEHFSDTSFAATDASGLVAFLIGFRSQTDARRAYIHLVGVAPRARGSGIGRRLYERFFAIVSGMGCTDVSCITSPVNAGSIAFHRSMGFSLVPSDFEEGGVPIQRNHAGPGEHRVMFRKVLG